MSEKDRQTQRQRLQNARQVLAGDSVRPSPDPWVLNDGAFPLTLLQRNYLIALIVLLVVGGLLIWLTGLGIASIVLFVLALGLIASWIVF